MARVKQQMAGRFVGNGMARLASSNGVQPRGGAYRVELPRPGDAIGGLLRESYADAQDLPNDMRKLLRKLGGPVATSRDR